MMKIMGAFVLVIGIIVLLLELKDKIKIKSYERIFTIHMYVDGSIYYNKGFQVEAYYYDNEYQAFNKTTMHIDKIDARYQPIRAGQIIKVLVGFKKSKIHYIVLKN